MPLKARAARGGFTLIELVMVVVVIGILAAAAIPIYRHLVRTSREGATRGNLGAMRSAMHSFYAQSALQGNARWPNLAELAAVFPDGQIPRNEIIFGSTNHDARSRDISTFPNMTQGPFSQGASVVYHTATHYGWFIYTETGMVHAYTDSTHTDPRAW